MTSPLSREPNASGRPIEQSYPELGLQLGDGTTDLGLRYPGFACDGAAAAEGGDLAKQVKTPETIQA